MQSQRDEKVIYVSQRTSSLQVPDIGEVASRKLSLSPRIHASHANHEGPDVQSSRNEPNSPDDNEDSSLWHRDAPARETITRTHLFSSTPPSAFPSSPKSQNSKPEPQTHLLSPASSPKPRFSRRSQVLEQQRLGNYIFGTELKKSQIIMTDWSNRRSRTLAPPAKRIHRPSFKIPSTQK
ncbi:hypothetical protein BC829DRAFT_33162 [Chytridium lagenaria]|nr:hypothetical protein BC829DRAFT_33162 [Chytridium lagenaria]